MTSKDVRTRKAAKRGKAAEFGGVPPRLTQAELMRVTGLSRQTLAEWAREPDCPVEVLDGRRYYLWPQWNEWRLAKVKKSSQREEKPSSFKEARARREAAMAELAELQLEHERKRLISVADAARESEQVFDRIRARLVAVPNKEAYRFLGLKKLPQAISQLNEVIDIVLQSLSSDGLDQDDEEQELEAA